MEEIEIVNEACRLLDLATDKLADGSPLEVEDLLRKAYQLLKNETPTKKPEPEPTPESQGTEDVKTER